ncbi:hypothetical protein ACO22_03374 [Paracoccidioides brasiliensis]|uniref:Uncharacterized protein n=1 Tax=Paracoccidioides brasiliensis TaxID=121759 RepID=A0A1D2JGC5_PARBR|nr:hypothetical protein ACO22_03374 [Paracoccidioides brasiliensis]
MGATSHDSDEFVHLFCPIDGDEYLHLPQNLARRRCLASTHRPVRGLDRALQRGQMNADSTKDYSGNVSEPVRAKNNGGSSRAKNGVTLKQAKRLWPTTGRRGGSTD